MDQNSQSPPVHMLNACEPLTDKQLMQVCLALDVDKCVRDEATLTYYFYLKK